MAVRSELVYNQLKIRSYSRYPMSVTDTDPNARHEDVIKKLCLENNEESVMQFPLTVEDHARKEHIRLAALLDSLFDAAHSSLLKHEDSGSE